MRLLLLAALLCGFASCTYYRDCNFYSRPANPTITPHRAYYSQYWKQRDTAATAIQIQYNPVTGYYEPVER